MTINYNILEKINETLKNFPSAKLQIVKNKAQTIKELMIRDIIFGENKVQKQTINSKTLILPT